MTKKTYFEEEFYDNDQLKSRINYNKKNGRKDGLSESYHENGQLLYRGNYKNGKEDGLEEWFYPNGQLKFRGNYIDGKEDGTHEDFYKNGKISMVKNYKDGQLHGFFIKYGEYGERFLTEYENGKLMD